MNWKIPLLPQKRTKTTFRSNFVNRGMKPPIITEKTDIRLNGAPFGTVTYKIHDTPHYKNNSPPKVADPPTAGPTTTQNMNR